MVGQVLEDGPLQLGGGGQVEAPGQGQHRHPILAGGLDLHGAAFIFDRRRRPSDNQAKRPTAVTPDRPVITAHARWL
jgi:hypothetical protein